MRLLLAQMKGRMGRRDKRNLLPGFAQVCENVWFGKDDVRPLEQPVSVLALAKANALTIYRFGLALNNALQYWFHWTTDVDVVRAQVPGDTEERTYWTGDGVPKYTTAALGTAGSNLPSASRPLGMPPPTLAPTLTPVSGTGTTGAQRRLYFYTIGNEFGDESAPSPMAQVDVVTGQHVTLSNLQTVASNGAPVTFRRIYRADAGTLLFAAEIGGTGTTYLDTLGSEALGPGTCPSITWDAPPAALRALVAMPNGILAGLDGDDLCFCEPERPYAWPADYRVPSRFPTVGLGVVGQAVLVLTTGTHRFVGGMDPAGMTEEDCKLAQPCVAKRSIVSTGDDVLFASEDGLCAAVAAKVLTEDLFAPEEWKATFFPSTIVGTWHQGWYIGTYDPGTGRKGFMYRPATQTWVDLPQFTAVGFYRDTVTKSLYCIIGNAVHRWRGAGTVYPMRWRSGVFTSDYSDFPVARVEKGAGAVTVRVYGDDVLRDETSVTSPLPYMLGGNGGQVLEWEVEVAASAATNVVAVGLFQGFEDAAKAAG